MTDRRSPEQVISDLESTIHPGSPRAISDFVAHAEVPDIIPGLLAAGYVIVHPDDVPTMEAGDDTDAWSIGTIAANYWNACRKTVFG
jgi:hypothetical protein